MISCALTPTRSAVTTASCAVVELKKYGPDDIDLVLRDDEMLWHRDHVVAHRIGVFAHQGLIGSELRWCGVTPSGFRTPDPLNKRTQKRPG